jgi:hypothetical protein
VARGHTDGTGTGRSRRQQDLPGQFSLFASTVHPELLDNCVSCHTDSASDAQSPFFANADRIRRTSAKSKIDLDNRPTRAS